MERPERTVEASVAEASFSQTILSLHLSSFSQLIAVRAITFARALCGTEVPILRDAFCIDSLHWGQHRGRVAESLRASGGSAYIEAQDAIATRPHAACLHLYSGAFLPYRAWTLHRGRCRSTQDTPNSQCRYVGRSVVHHRVIPAAAAAQACSRATLLSSLCLARTSFEDLPRDHHRCSAMASKMERLLASAPHAFIACIAIAV